MLEEKEVRGIIRMLKATSERVEHLMMTGILDNAKAPTVIRQYNAIVKRLADDGTIPEGLFITLGEDSLFGDVGMYCNQLASYLEGILEEPSEEKKAGVPHINAPIISIGKGSDVKDIGELIRQAMPDWIKKHIVVPEEAEAKEEKKTDMNDLESRMAELGAQMQVLAEKMHREELSGDEVRKIAEQMRQLGQQQADLAKQFAASRSLKTETKE